MLLLILGEAGDDWDMLTEFSAAPFPLALIRETETTTWATREDRGTVVGNASPKLQCTGQSWEIMPVTFASIDSLPHLGFRDGAWVHTVEHLESTFEVYEYAV
jgi:hypothetical protein